MNNSENAPQPKVTLGFTEPSTTPANRVVVGEDWRCECGVTWFGKPEGTVPFSLNVHCPHCDDTAEMLP